MIRREPLEPAARPELVRALASLLAADVREFPTRAEASGVSPSGDARSEARVVVGRLHPPLAGLSTAALVAAGSSS
jgi:hypothetical protein